MNTNLLTYEKWSDVLDYKARILYAQIAEMRQGVIDHGGTEEQIEILCEPYIELLKSMYAEDYPLAKAIEESDLLLRLEGPAINKENPRLSVITGVFKNVRTEVANIAKAIAQISDSKKRLPKEMDLGLSAYAKGSLILGFTLPSAEELEESAGGQQSLLGEQDPLYQAAREAIRTIGVITRHLSEGKTVEDLSDAIPDPRVRDTALLAIEKLSPTGRQGIQTVSISGKQTGGEEPVQLTSIVREDIRQHLQQPVISDEEIDIVGDVREIDLDANRFEIRHIENMEINDVRCKYKVTDAEASDWLNKRVRVHGIVERDASGRPRLLDVTSVKVLR